MIGKERAKGGSLTGAKFGFLKANDFESAEVRNGAVKRVIKVVGVFRERSDVVGDQGEVRDRVGVGEVRERIWVGKVRGGEGGRLEERRDWGLMGEGKMGGKGRVA